MGAALMFAFAFDLVVVGVALTVHGHSVLGGVLIVAAVPLMWRAWILGGQR